MKKPTRAIVNRAVSQQLLRSVRAKDLRLATGGTETATTSALPDLDTTVGHSFGLEP